MTNQPTITQSDNRTTINLRGDAVDARGHYVHVALDSGLILRLWIYEDQGTTSVDVSATRADDQIVLDHVIEMPSAAIREVAAVVIENRS